MYINVLCVPYNSQKLRLVRDFGSDVQGTLSRREQAFDLRFSYGSGTIAVYACINRAKGVLFNLQRARACIRAWLVKIIYLARASALCICLMLQPRLI